jgi:hypothetical protein
VVGGAGGIRRDSPSGLSATGRERSIALQNLDTRFFVTDLG